MPEYPAMIRRRSGRRSKNHNVILTKPPEDYRQSEKFEVEIEGRMIPVHVEIPISKTNSTLYVA